MTSAQLKWQDLFDFLKEKGCDGDFRYTIEFFTKHKVPIESVISEIARAGTCCCDCELLSNLCDFIDGEDPLG